MSEEKKEEMKTPEQKTKPAETAAPKKKKRLWLRILGWAAVVIVVLLIAAVIARDAIIKSAVVNIGSSVTGTKVEMESFSSSFGGTVELTGFKVANPPGYLEPYAFQVAKVKVGVDVGSLFSDRIEVNEVLVNGTKVNFELKLDGSSNLTDIKKNIETFSGDSKQPSAPAEEPKAEPEKSDAAKKKVVIRLVKIEGTELSVSSALLKSNVPLPIPTITLTDLGEGKTFGETVNEFATKVLAALMTALSDSGLQGVGDTLKDAGKNLSDSLRQGSGSLKDAGKNLENTVKDLFKSKK
ncbi:MAG: hypothetical protein HPZ91_12410 [Lentisphaeria bacterium]|nr:hypothetical protein [Lentisphaeria bacterium]